MKWEYSTLTIETDRWTSEEYISKRLNNMGKDGWEMVSAFGTSKFEGVTREVVMIFKRPLQ